MIHETADQVGRSRRTRRRDDAGDGQLTLAHALEQQRPPRPAGPNARRLAHTEALASSEQAARPFEDRVRHEAISRVRRALVAYINQIGVGAEFQAADFNDHCHRVGVFPIEAIDARCTGAMFRRLVDRGVLTRAGFRMNAGSSVTGYRATPRAVYRVERTALPEDLL